MTIPERVREHCAAIARSARHVSIDLDAAGRIEPGPPPALDPERHYLEGSREDVAMYMLTLDAVNFGSRLVPDSPQASRVVGLLHGRVEPGRALPRRSARGHPASCNGSKPRTWRTCSDRTRATS